MGRMRTHLQGSESTRICRSNWRARRIRASGGLPNIFIRHFDEALDRDTDESRQSLVAHAHAARDEFVQDFLVTWDKSFENAFGYPY